MGSTVQNNGESRKELKKLVEAGWNYGRKVSGVFSDESFRENERNGVEDGGLDLTCCWFRDCGSEEKTGGRVGGSRG